MARINIEVYNDNINKVNIEFKELRIVDKAGEAFVMLVFDEVHVGPAGNFTVPFTMYATNEMRVPVYKRNTTTDKIEPIMLPGTGVVGDENYVAPKQASIGEFDMWMEALLKVFKTAVENGILRKKGKLTDTLKQII